MSHRVRFPFLAVARAYDVGRKDVPVRHCSLHRPERGASLMPTRWLLDCAVPPAVPAAGRALGTLRSYHPPRTCCCHRAPRAMAR